MWLWIVAGTVGLLVTALAVRSAYRYLEKIVRHSISRQFEMPEKKQEKELTWDDMGIPEELQKEFREFEALGIEIQPLTEKELEEMTERTLASLREYEACLRDVRTLERNTVIKSARLQYGMHTLLENGEQAIEIIKSDDVYTKKIFPDSYDSKREDALFVIEERKFKRSYRGAFALRKKPKILLRRLAKNGAYDPQGELLVLEKILEQTYPLRVELVGHMNDDRTMINYAFPQK